MKRKPGLETLSDLRKLSTHRSIIITSLREEVDWDQVFQSKNSSHPELLNADLYAKEHIQ